jgi:hypothetical protein
MSSTEEIVIEQEVNPVRIAPRAGQEEATSQWYMKSENLSATPWTQQRFLRGYNVTYAELEEADFFAMRWLYENNHSGIRFWEKGKDSIDESWTKAELVEALEDNFPFFCNRRVPRLWRDNAISGFVNMAADALRKIEKSADFAVAPRKAPRYTDYSRKRAREEEEVSRPTKRPKSTAVSAALLSFTKVLVRDRDEEGEFVIFFLRDIIKEGEPELDSDWNLNAG